MVSIEDAEGDEAWSGAVRFRSLSNLSDIFKLPRYRARTPRFRSQFSRATTRAV